VSGCAEETRDMRAQHFWRFPLYRPLDSCRGMLLSSASTVVENQTFDAQKIIINS